MDESEKILAAYTLVSEQIAREDHNIHRRTVTALFVNGILGTLAAIGYSLAKDHIKDPRDFIIFALLLFALAFLAIWVSATAIRGIAQARTQNAYTKDFYDRHWKDKVAHELNLPRPFGGPGYADKNEAGKTIKEGAGGAGTLFWAVILVWTVALAIMIATGLKWFLGE